MEPDSTPRARRDAAMQRIAQHQQEAAAAAARYETQSRMIDNLIQQKKYLEGKRLSTAEVEAQLGMIGRQRTETRQALEAATSVREQAVAELDDATRLPDQGD